MTHLLQLRNDAVGDARNTLGQHRIEHAIENVHLVLDGKVDEVSIDQHEVRRAKLHIVLKEERRPALLDLADVDLVNICLFHLIGSFLLRIVLVSFLLDGL